MIFEVAKKKIFNVEQHTAERRHECAKCHKFIARGSEAKVVSVRYDRELYPFYFHEQCYVQE